MTKPARLRFAPSPTGALHLGGIRSALYDWLLARQSQGVFILRIEDTDRERLQSDSIAQIQDSLRWLGLDWDEGAGGSGQFGPYVQSERLDIYRQHADQLVKTGALYPCWCSPERLDGLRKAAQVAGKAFKYDRHCLAEPGNPNEPHVLRFKVPESGMVGWDDAVRGHLEVSSSDIDDFVAMKSDGYPTYNFANVVDDHAMEITTVLRGDEFIPTTPKNLLVYEAFGWTPPTFGHLPQVLGTDKAKLSKRHGAKSVLEYRDTGYLPEAVINYMALLGWNDGTTQEIFTRDELIQKFSLDRVHKSPAVFDPERLDWMNGEYIRALSVDDLFERLLKFAPSDQISQQLAKDGVGGRLAVALVQDRLKRLSEGSDLLSFFFTDPDPKTLPYPSKLKPDETKRYLEVTLTGLSKLVNFSDPAELEKLMRGPVATETGVGEQAGPLFMTVRVAITGQTATPGLFETMKVLGQEAVTRRLRTAVDEISKTK